MKTSLIKQTIAYTSLILILVLTGAVVARGQAEQQKKALSPIMRQKLKLSQSVLQGLTEEDFDLVSDSANRLKALSENAGWRVSPNVTYLKYSAEFTSLNEELARRAKEKDLNGSTLSYIRMTINCIDCHKFVRDNHILDPKLQGK